MFFNGRSEPWPTTLAPSRKSLPLFERLNSKHDSVGRSGAQLCGDAPDVLVLPDVQWNRAPAKRVRQMSNVEFQERLVEHFDILY